MPKIYVELDSLLDTRYGTWISIDETIAIDLMKANYRNREVDQWSLLVERADQSIFDRVYGERGLDILKMSKPTALIPFINHLITEIAFGNTQLPTNDETVLVVNTYPYQFSDEVKNQVLAAIQYTVGPNVTITDVYHSIDALTPSTIKVDYDAVILYDFNAWILTQEEAIRDTKIPHVYFIIPTILRNLENNTLKDVKSYDISPFAALEMSLSEYLSLQCIDTKYFSLIELETNNN